MWPETVVGDSDGKEPCCQGSSTKAAVGAEPWAGMCVYVQSRAIRVVWVCMYWYDAHCVSPCISQTL